VETFTHDEARRLNIPTSELSAVARKADMQSVKVAYARRDADLDPQLIWRGKYGPEGMEGEAGGLIVRAAPLYIQEKVHPKALIDDLKRGSEERAKRGAPPVAQQSSLFADFNGIPEGVDKTEFYQHEQNWSNRLILGDSLQVMAGLTEREGLRGKVQCIYFDPPYGIKFNSNFQWSTTSRDVKDNKADHITREPEQVKAFRDTWRDGIHSYLSYLRDRLTVARDLLTESGSIFVQISDENIHMVRNLLDEVFGQNQFISQISFAKTTGFSSNYLSNIVDYILWYGKNKDYLKYREQYTKKEAGDIGATAYKDISLLPVEGYLSNIYPTARLGTSADLTSQGALSDKY
jgi:adenine-specific DNA-methyltransferase